MRKAALVSLMLVLAACDTTPAPTPPLGTAGGSVASADARATLDVPAGALTGPTTVTFTKATTLPPAPGGKALVPNTAYTVAGSTTPTASMTLKLKYSAAQVAALGLDAQANVASLRMYQLLNNVWTPVPGSTVDELAAWVRAQISVFGTFALMADQSPAAPVLTTITVTPATASTAVGGSVQFTAVGKDQFGAALSPQPAFTWSSGDRTVATVDGSGRATGVTAGNATITASTTQNISGQATLTVTGTSPTGSYTATSLVKSNFSGATALNNAGTVLLGDMGRLELHRAGVKTTLPALPADYKLGFGSSPLCLNESDNVMMIGTYDKTGSPRTHSLFYYARAAGSLTEQALGSDYMYIGGCNDANSVVMSVPFTPRRHVSWTAGQSTLTDIPVPAAAATGYTGHYSTDLNNAGTMLFSNGIVSGGVFTQIARPAGQGIVSAVSITRQGLVYGTLGAQEVFTWKAGDAEPSVLGQLPAAYAAYNSYVIDVNEGGQVLLMASDGAARKLFFVSSGGTFNELKVSGYTLTDVRAINDAGWILAEGHGAADFTRQVLLLKP